ncbi:MAG: four helix bundle protein [Kiritimatiellae bacterium]|nr:four helix bundle protein [Kiritimatiellia bacterium]
MERWDEDVVGALEKIGLVKEERARYGRRERSEFQQRLKNYALQVIFLYVGLPKTREETQIIGRQLLKSGTSVAANYREASRARSRAEFLSKVGICEQEADESLLWLELLSEGCGVQTDKQRWLLGESDELLSIFVAMSRKAKASKQE